MKLSFGKPFRTDQDDVNRLSSFNYFLQANLKVSDSTSVHAFTPTPAEFSVSISTSCYRNEENKGLTAFHSLKNAHILHRPSRISRMDVILTHHAQNVFKPMKKINLHAALVSMDFSEDILYSVVAAFIEEAPNLVKKLDDAILADDRTTAGRAAHTLKSNFRILQFQNQQVVWAEIEAIIHDEGLSNIPKLLATAKTVTDDVLAQLREIMDARQA